MLTAHLIDDLEKERAAAVRALRRSDRLVLDAIHAVQNGRYEVAVELMDRALARRLPADGAVQ